MHNNNNLDILGLRIHWRSEWKFVNASHPTVIHANAAFRRIIATQSSQCFWLSAAFDNSLHNCSVDRLGEHPDTVAIVTISSTWTLRLLAFSLYAHLQTTVSWTRHNSPFRTTFCTQSYSIQLQLTFQQYSYIHTLLSLDLHPCYRSDRKRYPREHLDAVATVSDDPLIQADSRSNSLHTIAYSIHKIHDHEG